MESWLRDLNDDQPLSTGISINDNQVSDSDEPKAIRSTLVNYLSSN